MINLYNKRSTNPVVHFAFDEKEENLRRFKYKSISFHSISWGAKISRGYSILYEP